MGKGKAEPLAEAVQFAAAMLRQGAASAAVKAELRQGFGLDGLACNGTHIAAVAELVADLETGGIERWLAEQTRRVDHCRDEGERRRLEQTLVSVWTAFDELLEDDAPPRRVIEAARKLDRLLSLGWAARLPPGCLD